MESANFKYEVLRNSLRAQEKQVFSGGLQLWFDLVIHKVLHLKCSCSDYFGADFLTIVFQLKISFYFIFPKPRSFFFQAILTQLVALVKKYSNIQTKQESIAEE